MSEENYKKEKCNNPKHHIRHGGEAFYGLGFIGACIYFLSTAPTFWVGVLGILKSIVWPVFFVLESFKAFGL